jgi:hypothetical protein
MLTFSSSSVAPVAKSATGRWVSRVGASGGGKAYKKTRPANFYGAIALIVIFGLLAVVLARYDYQHPSKHSAGPEPRIGQTWYAGLSIQACGKRLPYLATNAATHTTGFAVLAENVIRISPSSAADAGANATLSQFADEYKGLLASTNQLSVPTSAGVANPKTTYTNGEACPAGTKYAGQVGKVTYAYWTSFGVKPKVTTNPSSIKFTNQMRVTMAFDPVNVTPLEPTAKTAQYMLAYNTATSTTTTIATATTTTLKPGTTTTTTPTTTTTAPTTTTTSKG